MQKIKYDINSLYTKIKLNKGNHKNLISNVKEFIVTLK